MSTPTSIATLSGQYFDYLNPGAWVPNAMDIAVPLARISRFNGHSRAKYTVAEHSVHVSRSLPNHLALAGLLHEVSEAFMGDATAPLKVALPEFKTLETQIENVLLPMLGVPLKTYADPMIKEADLHLLGIEQQQVMGNGDKWGVLVSSRMPSVSIQFWDEDTALKNFLDEWAMLDPSFFQVREESAA